MANVRDSVRDWVHANACAGVGESEWKQLRACFAKVSERTLRHAVREAGFPLAPVVEGVNQATFEDLERTLVALEREYAAGGAERRKTVLKTVQEARKHALLASKNAKVDALKRLQKHEMALWMLEWLENPPVFPLWVELRKAAKNPANPPCDAQS